jgi:hypothetical protein
MSDRNLYNLIVDDGNTSQDFVFSKLNLALEEAENRFEKGAFSVRVYHYTNNGANCIDDLWRERA